MFKLTMSTLTFEMLWILFQILESGRIVKVGVGLDDSFSFTRAIFVTPGTQGVPPIPRKYIMVCTVVLSVVQDRHGYEV